jgi:hypothetical protein
MKILVTMLRENDDGSADVRLETDEEGAESLLVYGFEHALREGIKNMAVKVTDEDRAWDDFEKIHEIQNRNKASMAAWNAAADFVVKNADKLSRLTLREAFEKGFMEGYKFKDSK